VTPRLALVYGFRWDADFPPSAINGPPLLGVTGFNDLSTLALAPTGTPAFKTTYGNFAPRVGWAYQLRQTSRWEAVLREGVGLFYDLATAQIGAAYPSNFFPFGAQKRATSNFPLTPSVTQPPPISESSLAAPGAIFVAVDPKLKLPRIFQWNVTMEQSLGKEQALSVAYVAAVGRRLLQQQEVIFPNPNFFAVELFGNSATSDYQSLQVQFQRRLSHGLQSLVSYTWGHSIDTASSGSGGAASNFFVGTLGPNE